MTLGKGEEGHGRIIKEAFRSGKKLCRSCRTAVHEEVGGLEKRFRTVKRHEHDTRTRVCYSTLHVYVVNVAVSLVVLYRTIARTSRKKYVCERVMSGAIGKIRYANRIGIKGRRGIKVADGRAREGVTRFLGQFRNVIVTEERGKCGVRNGEHEHGNENENKKGSRGQEQGSLFVAKSEGDGKERKEKKA